QPHRNGDHGTHWRLQPAPGNDRAVGHARTRPGGAPCGAVVVPRRRQAGGGPDEFATLRRKRGGPMKTPDLLELAARNLRESVLRNSLTTLGIGVGVASLVAMLSLGVGLQQLFTRRLERTGLFDTVMVTRGDFGGFGARPRGAAAADNSRALDENVRQEISRLPGVLEAVPDLRMMTQMRYGDKPHRAMVAAVPMTARDREAFENIQGSFFSSGNAAEAIVQKPFAEELLGI